ncbi:MAG: S8 family serine peptidase, partial [Deltaproteobacteria bacterium]|nr:S8 family serine peptidase [Deltaproteobacteria bacterium]
MTVGTTPRDVVDELLGPPVGEVVTAIAEDSDTAALTAQLERELDRRPDAPAHRVHAIDDARSAAAAVVALRKEPRAIHIFRLADGARRDLLSLLDRRRSTLALATLLLVVSPTAFAEARRDTPNLASFFSTTTRRVPGRFRVVAHPMHEHEHAALFNVGDRLQQLDESIVVGELDGAQIDHLRAQNILVDVYGPAEIGGAPLLDTLWSPIAAAPPPDIGGWPGDFEVTIDPAALIVLDRQPLPGVEVLEPLGNRRYRVRLADAAAHAALVASSGVGDDARVDTSPMVSQLKSVELDATWTVLLHDAATRDAVRARLEGVRAIILKADGRALRITALPSIVDRARTWPEVRRIDAYVEPTLSADVYRGQVGLEIIDAAGAPGDTLPWDGTGEVVAMADSGIDAAHPALHSAIASVLPLARPGDGSDHQGHGTHVAGIIAGRAAVQPLLRGAAPGARLVVQCIVDADAKLSGLPADLSTLLQSAYDLGARVHNNSWGAEVEGRYDAQAEQIDEFVWKHRDMLVVIAAGNRGRAA